MTKYSPDICELIVNRFRWVYSQNKSTKQDELIEFDENPNILNLSIQGKKYKITVEEIK